MVQQENQAETQSLHSGKVDEPEDAIVEEIALTIPVECSRENDSVASA